MNSRTIWRLMIAGACLTALSGCTIAILMNMEPEQRAALFLVPADRAVVYFYRDDANNDALPLAFSVDGNPLLISRPSKFLFYEIKPGPHTLVSWDADSDSIALETEAGKTYFVREEVVCDASHLHLRLRTDDAAAGRARVRALYAAGKAGAPEDARTTGYSTACPSSVEVVGGTPL